MVKLVNLIACLLLVCCNVFAQTASDFSILYEYPTMNRFYRNMPLLVENFYLTPDDAHLNPPAYLTDNSISFKYQKRTGFTNEVMFADNVNLVRFLGGWSAYKNNTTVEDISKWDLAYRDVDGKIKYRWNLIPSRIDPVLQMGYYSPNIVLDNTPWCFPAAPAEPLGEGYGQCMPPADLVEWGQFITDLCNELVRLYGYNTVNNWGFRLGTEAGGVTRFNGTPEEYRAFYKTTAVAIKAILPNARVFPYNRAGKGHDNLKTLLTEAIAQNFPYTTSPISTYSIAQVDTLTNQLVTNSVNPNYVAAGAATTMWYDMDAITPASTLSREVHEFGWFLVNELGDRDNAPGARGAAGNFHYIMNLRKYRLDKLFHWSVIDPPDDLQKNILNSQGFIYSVWDYCNDATRVVELNNVLKLEPQGSQLYKSVGYFKPTGKSYIMVSGFNMNRKHHKKNELSVFIPKSEYSKTNIKVTYTTLNDSTDHYRMLRNDLSDKSVLYEAYENDSNYIAQYNTMSAKGKYWLQTDNDKYAQRIKENLTLKPYRGKVQITNDGIILTFPINTPELFVIALEEDMMSGSENLSERLNSVSLYPRAVTDIVIINTTNPEKVDIYDVAGHLVCSFNLFEQNKINVGSLSKGVYFLKIKHNGLISTEKILKI